METNILYHQSCMDGLTEIEDETIKLIVTSPPYPKGMREYEEECSAEADKYVDWIKPLLKGAYRVLHPSGSMILVLMDKIIDGEMHPYLDELKLFVRKIGFKVVDDIIWHKCLAGSTHIYAKSKKGEMPMLIKDMARLKPETVKLWNGTKWTQVLACNRLPQKKEMLKITLRSGESISCTPEHRFQTQRGLLDASDINLGDILEHTYLPEPKTPKDSKHIGLDAAWLAGLYLAEGSMADDTIQIAGHIKEEKRWERIQKIAKDYGGTTTRTINGNHMDIRIYGKLLVAITKELVCGTEAKNKSINSVCWRYSNRFLVEMLNGYLSGDGHWDSKNERWRLGFCRNYNLERDFRALSARLDFKLTLQRGMAKCSNGKFYPSFRGTITFRKSNHLNIKQRYEVVNIGKAPLGTVYDICVEDEPHLFALASGVLTHNSNPLPNVKYSRRPIRAYEHCIWLVKNIELYTWNHDDMRKPYSEATIARYGAVGNIETLHKRSGGQANQTWVDVEPNPRGAACNNIITGCRFSGRDPGHPAKFPEYLPAWFIKSMSAPGDIILDPFAGSGTTLIAAKKLDRLYVGYDIGESYVKRAEKDLAACYSQIEM